MKKQYLKLFIITIFFVSCGNHKETPPEIALKNSFNNRNAAQAVLRKIVEKKIPVTPEITRILVNHLRKHPSWFPLTIINLLKNSQDEEFNKSLLELVKKFPGDDYYPARDDASFILSLELLLSKKYEKTNKAVFESLKKLPDILTDLHDPLQNVRLGVIKKSLKYLKSFETYEIARKFLRFNKGQHYRVNCEAARALSVTGYSSEEVVMDLIPMLFTVRDGESGSVFASMALSAASGKARTKAISVLSSIIRTGGTIIDNLSGCRNSFGKNSELLCDSFKKILYSGQLNSNNVLLESTAIRALNFMGEYNQIKSLFSDWSGDRLVLKWSEQLALNTMKVQQNISLSELALARDSIPSFDRDLAVRNELMITLSENGSLRSELLKYVTQGMDSTIMIPVVEALSILPPDKETVAMMELLAKRGCVAVTSSIYYSVLRMNALNQALDDPTVSQKLSAIWNSETTNKAQWEKTQSVWIKYLLKELKNFQECEKSETCFTPDEIFRLQILKYAWKHVDLNGALLLNAIKSTDILEHHSPGEEALKLKIVTRPWNDEVENKRRKAVEPVIRKKLLEFVPVFELLKKCKKNPECYALSLKSSPSLDIKIKAARMFRYTARPENIGLLIDVYEKASPEGRGELILWLEHQQIPLKDLEKLMMKVKKLEKANADYVNNMKVRILYNTARRKMQKNGNHP
ncbi:MAG: hypothetical protein JXR95_13155 [Deltaproteobacteria bacterium]|nr:hypothetical protein [Deltaproteobacteria bacterium]